tara:strand:+ start:103 stop:480 length:378 start_codon:yes stop_codon:yes gene_type:complete
MNTINFEDITDFITTAPNKALATKGPHGLNVIPVSTLKIHQEAQIMLVNYFMNKTIDNLKQDEDCSLVCWNGGEGYQIKGLVDYKTSGKTFDQISHETKMTFPNRTVQGILLFSPKEIFTVSIPL